ncbi:MAG TPA: hypothetical protein DFR83_00830 [Deltaproteobacteria bacterium]|nr:hypothetical protein [Deltaproteobacteria bacterium]
MSVDNDPNRPVLYQHARRPQWGLAILCGEDKTSRTFQFQDGRTRTFKEGWYQLMEPVEVEEEETNSIANNLSKAMDRQITRSRIMERAKKEGRNIFTVSDQINLFRKQYPDGFSDARYIEEVREGGGGGRRRKKNRQAGLEHAQTTLSVESLDNLIGEYNYRAVYEAAIAALSKTDIASTSTDVRPLRRLPEELVPEFAVTLRDLLYGEDPYPDRFGGYLALLEDHDETRPTWPMATVIQGLVHPQTHFCIKPSVFRQQARWLAPELSYSPTPSADRYEQYRSMAEDLKVRLQRGGLEPVDNLDIYNFIWETMRPGVREDLLSVKR